MTAACTLLTNYMKLFTLINTMALGENVADTVMNTIEDCVSDSSDVTVLLFKDNILSDGATRHENRIIYKTPNGNDVTIYAFDDTDTDNDGILRLLQSDTFPDPDDSKKWSLGKEAYMKYRISNLDFEKNDKNILKVDLEIKNTQTGSVTKRTKLIECYGLKNKKEINLIDNR